MESGSKAEDWLAGKSLSSSQLLAMLKLYGRTAGISEEKLTLMALRRTAVRLRLDEGASPEEMRAFLDSQEAVKSTKYRLGKLPQLPQGEKVEGKGEEGEIQSPDHKSRPFKLGDGIKHGFYARSQPAEAVETVLREDIRGVEEEIVGLRTLARGLLERQERARNNQEALHLAEAYSLAAYRLAEMIKAEKELAERGKSSQAAEEFLERLDQMQIERGEEPIAEAIRAEALGSKPELGITSRRLAEEIASTRYSLRNVFRWALEAQETREYIRMVEIYGTGCVRLMRSLKIEKGDTNRLDAYLNEVVNQAIREVTKELGLEE